MNRALRYGTVVWRVGRHSGLPLRCMFVRHIAGGMVELRADQLAVESVRARAEDVFASRELCRKEIDRRNKQGDLNV